MGCDHICADGGDRRFGGRGVAAFQRWFLSRCRSGAAALSIGDPAAIGRCCYTNSESHAITELSVQQLPDAASATPPSAPDLKTPTNPKAKGGPTPPP